MKMKRKAISPDPQPQLTRAAFIGEPDPGVASVLRRQPAGTEDERGPDGEIRRVAPSQGIVGGGEAAREKGGRAV
jgi:hypothetical protein